MEYFLYHVVKRTQRLPDIFQTITRRNISIHETAYLSADQSEHLAQTDEIRLWNRDTKLMLYKVAEVGEFLI